MADCPCPLQHGSRQEQFEDFKNRSRLDANIKTQLVMVADATDAVAGRGPVRPADFLASQSFEVCVCVCLCFFFRSCCLPPLFFSIALPTLRALSLPLSSFPAALSASPRPNPSAGAPFLEASLKRVQSRRRVVDALF